MDVQQGLAFLVQQGSTCSLQVPCVCSAMTADYLHDSSRLRGPCCGPLGS
jgi:hypothetical protein